MLAEVIIATSGAVVLGIVGLALRFVRLTLHPEQVTQAERAKALDDLEHAMRNEYVASTRAVLVTRGHLLPPKIANEARAWAGLKISQSD